MKTTYQQFLETDKGKLTAMQDLPKQVDKLTNWGSAWPMADYQPCNTKFEGLVPNYGTPNQYPYVTHYIIDPAVFYKDDVVTHAQTYFGWDVAGNPTTYYVMPEAVTYDHSILGYDMNTIPPAMIFRGDGIHNETEVFRMMLKGYPFEAVNKNAYYLYNQDDKLTSLVIRDAKIRISDYTLSYCTSDLTITCINVTFLC